MQPIDVSSFELFKQIDKLQGMACDKILYLTSITCYSRKTFLIDRSQEG